MNVSLTQKLEALIEKKIKSGLYNNASEVVRDALRRAFYEDTPELTAMARDGINSRNGPRRKGDIKRLLRRHARK